MGDETRLLCSETRPHNDAKELKDIFLSRFKLSDDFWKELFDNNCPEGLGEVNEKLTNGEDLSSSDFKSVEDFSIHRDDDCSVVDSGINKPKVLQLNTPLLKSLSNTSYSPSLFSPFVIHDNNGKKGPDSSTPLPVRSALSSSVPDAVVFNVTPTLTNNVFHDGFKTPLGNVLDQNFTKTAASKLSRSLSATLEMDPVDNMNLSWTSSLATPPTEQSTTVNNGNLKGTSFLDISEILSGEKVVCKTEGKNRSSKGVARVLFNNESQGFEDNPFVKEISEINITTEKSAILNLPMYSNTSVKKDTFAEENEFENNNPKISDHGNCAGCFIDGVETTGKNPDNIVVNAIEENPRQTADKSTPCQVSATFAAERCSYINGSKEVIKHTESDVTQNRNFNAVDYFDTSLLSPLHGSVEQAVVELSALADITKTGLPVAIQERSIEIDDTKESVDKCVEGSNEIINEALRNTNQMKKHVRAKHELNPRENDQNIHCFLLGESDILDVNNDEKRHSNRSTAAEDSELNQTLAKNANAVVEISGKSVSSKDEDNQVIFDMDTLSEFPLEYEFSERMTSPSDNALTVCTPKENNESVKQKYFSVNISDHDGADIGCYNGSPNNIQFSKRDEEVNTSDKPSEAVSCIGIDPEEDMKNDSCKINDIFTAQSNNMLDTNTEKAMLKNCCDDDKNEATAKPDQEIKTSKSIRNMETASQVFHDLSLQHLCDISYDGEGISNLEKILDCTSNIESMENLANVDNQVGHSADAMTNVDPKCSSICLGPEQTQESVSAKILTMIDEEREPLSNQVIENDKDKLHNEKWGNVPNESLMKSERILSLDDKNGEIILTKCKINEKSCLGFSTASGKKLTVSEESLNKARQIAQEIMNDEERKSQGGRRSVEKDSFGFSTASGKRVTVSETSLNKARQILNEVDEKSKPKVEESMCNKAGLTFLTSVNKVSVSEESFKEIRILNDDKESKYQDGRKASEKTNVGLCTASRKKVDVSEGSLVKVRKLLNEVNTIEESECKGRRNVAERGNSGFSTASGKKVAVSEESIKKARQVLNEVNNYEESKCQDDRRVDENTSFGFSTAAGKKVKISEESLKNARRILNEVKIDEESERQNNRIADEHTSVGFSTASGKKVKISDESMAKARRILNEVERDEERKSKDDTTIAEKPTTGFSTASGRKVTVSEESLRKARKILNEVNNDEESNRQDDCKVNKKPKVGFSTASRKNIEISEESSMKVRRILNEVDRDEERTSKNDRKVGVKSGFSTASGKKVTVSEKSLMKARTILNEVRNDEESGSNECKNGSKVNGKASVGFSTASGKKVTVSEKSLMKARTILNEVRNDEESGSNECKNGSKVNGKASVGFSTASGKKVTVSEKSLMKARTILNEVRNDEESGSNECKNGSKVNGKASVGFSTASGKKVTVSEKSLMKARTILNEVRNDEESGSNECKNGSKVNGKASVGFSTASGKKVTVSEKSLMKARTILNEVRNDEESGSNECKNGSKVNGKASVGFSTASGKKVTVSEKSLMKARTILNEVRNDEESECQDGSKVNGKASVGFSTASGKKVTVSEKSLMKARTILNEVRNDEESECQDGGKVNGKASVGFSTASGKKVKISEESLMKARTILNEVRNDEESECQDGSKVNGKASVGFSTASGKKVKISEESLMKARRILNEVNSVEENKDADVRQTNEKPATGFCTASGNKIKVSEESLMKARRILNEVDEDNENKSSDVRKGNENPIIGFSTALGRKVEFSAESVMQARTILNNADRDEKMLRKDGRKIGVTGFSTASGMKVEVSEESLKTARRILNDADREEKKLKEDGGKVGITGFSVSGLKVDVSEESLEKATILNDADEESLKKAKKILNDITGNEENQCQSSRRVEEKPGNWTLEVCEESLDNSRRITNGEHEDKIFCTVSTPGKKVTASEESLKKARTMDSTVNKTKGVNVLEQSMPDLPGKVDATMIPIRVGNPSLDVGTNCLQNVMNFSTDDMSERTHYEISESSRMLLLDESFIDLSPLIGTTRKENDCPSTNGKRSLSETGIEDVRPCKTFRTERGPSNVINKAGLHDNQEESRTRMKPYSSDPLEVYNDRKYSKFKSPVKPVVSSPDSEYTNQLFIRNQCNDDKSSTGVNDEQRHVKESSVNTRAKRKSNSHFSTPYRTAECNGKSANREESDKPRNDLENKNIKFCVGDKKCLIKPQLGSIYKLRNSPSFKRISFADYVGNENRNWSSYELFTHGIPEAVLSITCENAQSYRFKGSDFLSENACQSNTGARFTDGAVLFLGQDKCSGVDEFTNAFLRSPGVDCNLINKQWVANHYRWIIWKLASYEVVYPQLFFGRCLTPDMILRQLKYRYDREIDRCERSAIKKILERDDASSRGMVLCVSSMNPPDLDYEVKNGTKPNHQQINVEKEKIIMMTDGWYSIRVQLDQHLQSLARERMIYIGQKLYIQGAELVGSDQAVSPLEAPSNLHLRIHGNSTRPAKKFSRLGFHCKNSIFTVPIKSLSPDGGLVSSVDVVIARQYPLQFMEKLSDGKCVFRNPRCEERVAKKFEQEIQRKREKTMFQVQAEIDQEERQTIRFKRRKRDPLSTQKIQSLFDGKEIFDAINNASDPCSIQEALSNEQRRLLDNYTRNIRESNHAIMRRKYDEAWKKLCDDETLERNVVPVLKVKLVDSLFNPERNKAEGTALLTIWRPSEQIITMLAEGKRLKMYNVYASRYNKSTNNIQLSSNRSTVYKELPIETKFQDIFQARKVYSFSELSKGLKPGVEVDVVAVVVSHSFQSNLTLVYLADSDLNFVRLKIWGGLEDGALQDVIKEKAVVAACNLMSQPDRRSGIPSLKYYELSVVSTNPSNKMLRSKLRELKKSVLDADTYITNAKAKLSELCGGPLRWSTPKGRASSALHTMSSRSIDTKTTPENALQSNREVQVVEAKQALSAPSNASLSSSSPLQTCSKTAGPLQQSRKRLLHLKRRKLDLIPNPPPLSPLPCNLTASARKEFKVPRRIITRSKENDTNAEDE